MATRLNVVNPALREARNDLIYPPRADFRGDFTSSIIPQQSMGVISFTRATTATVTDNEGVIRNVYANEARFRGARRVENLFSYSHDYNNAYWNRVRATVVLNSGIGVDGKMTGAKITGTSPGGAYFYNAISYAVGSIYVISVRVKPINQTTTTIALFGNSSCVFTLTGSGSAGTPSGSSEMSDPRVTALANGYYRVSVKFTPTTSAAINTGFPLNSYVGDICYIDGVQLENVTGQSVQTPAEYVSTNVLTATPYHGANVDGVKYFDTDVNGVAIPKTTLKGLLAEGTRTNICNYSDFAFAGWGLIACTRAYNAGIAPDGTNSMVKIIPNAGTQSSYAYNVNITTTVQQYTVSCYVKAAGFNFVQFRFSSSISSGYANFDLQNGVVGTRSLWTSSGIETTSVAGVYRIWAVTDTVAATTAAIAIQVVPAANSITGTPITGDGVSGILAWGMQIENGPSVSSYIPTTTTTATRNIDRLIMDTTNSVDKYGACSFLYTLEDNEQFDRRAFSLTGNTPNRLQFQVKRAGLPGANLFYGDGAGVPSVTPGRDISSNNIVFAWTNLSNVSLYLDNTKYNSGVAPNLIFTTVDIGSAGGLSGFGCIKNVRIWKTRPTDAELLALSNSSY